MARHRHRLARGCGRHALPGRHTPLQTPRGHLRPSLRCNQRILVWSTHTQCASLHRAHSSSREQHRTQEQIARYRIPTAFQDTHAPMVRVMSVGGWSSNKGGPPGSGYADSTIEAASRDTSFL
eukprot:2035989-Rhodomonas_salina.2